jgi:hypothetical protein
MSSSAHAEQVDPVSEPRRGPFRIPIPSSPATWGPRMSNVGRPETCADELVRPTNLSLRLQHSIPPLMANRSITKNSCFVPYLAVSPKKIKHTPLLLGHFSPSGYYSKLGKDDDRGVTDVRQISRVTMMMNESEKIEAMLSDRP